MKQNPMCLDLETLPLLSALTEPYPEGERPPPANYRDPVKIQEWRETDERKWRDGRVKQCSLNPRLGRILCVGMSSSDGTDAAVNFAKTEDDEASLLRIVWDEIGMEGGEVVTWNGGFDLRFLVIRSMVHRINPTVRAETIRGWFRRYSTYPHFDCRAVLNNWETFAEGEGLTEWAKFFGLLEREEAIKNLTGADVSRLFAEGNLTLIEAYNAADIRDIKDIYERLAPTFTTLTIESAAA